MHDVCVQCERNMHLLSRATYKFSVKILFSLFCFVLLHVSVFIHLNICHYLIRIKHMHGKHITYSSHLNYLRILLARIVRVHGCAKYT